MRVNIISKANQVLKYLDPDFDTEGVDEGDWEEIYCEDFFSTGYADDAGAAHMFDYDYETGIVKFEYEGSEEDLIEIAKQGGDGGVEYIDDFLKKIKLFEEEFNIEWEIYEFIDDSGEDLGKELNQHNVHKKVTKELKKNHHLASFIIFYQEFLGYGEKKQPDDELNAVKKLMYKWKIISEKDDDGEVLELYEKIREGIKIYEDGFLKIGHTISNLNLDDNQILTFVKACIEMYLFTNSSDGKFTGDELVSDDEIKYRFYEGYDEETKKAFKNLKFLEIINDSIGDNKVVKILLDMIMNQLNQQKAEAIQNDELTFLIGKVNEYVSDLDPTPFLEYESFPLRWEADVLIQDYDFKENTLNLDEGDDKYLTSIGTAIEIKKYDNGSYEFWDGVYYKESHSWISELNNNKDYPSFSLLNKKFEDFESLKSFLDETYG
jgi:hypothetical protein